MKKIILGALMLFLSMNSFSQKMKNQSATSTAKGVLAKTDNLQAEVKSGNFQLTITDKGKPTDAIVVKPADLKFAPTNCKLTAFKANGTTLYMLNWTEKILTKTDLKTEDATIINSNIYDVVSKKQVFANAQKTANIVEKVFLDKLKQASETQTKVHNEGYIVTLNPDGSITEKSKTQEIKLVYDPAKMEFSLAKKK